MNKLTIAEKIHQKLSKIPDNIDKILYETDFQAWANLRQLQSLSERPFTREDADEITPLVIGQLYMDHYGKVYIWQNGWHFYSDGSKVLDD